MKFNLSSKKSKIIVLSVLFFVFALSGGYLVWRINQPDTVAPEDSEASDACPGLTKTIPDNCTEEGGYRVSCDTEGSYQCGNICWKDGGNGVGPTCCKYYSCSTKICECPSGYSEVTKTVYDNKTCPSGSGNCLFLRCPCINKEGTIFCDWPDVRYDKEGNKIHENLTTHAYCRKETKPPPPLDNFKECDDCSTVYQSTIATWYYDGNKYTDLNHEKNCRDAASAGQMYQKGSNNSYVFTGTATYRCDIDCTCPVPSSVPIGMEPIPPGMTQQEHQACIDACTDEPPPPPPPPPEEPECKCTPICPPAYPNDGRCPTTVAPGYSCQDAAKRCTPKIDGARCGDDIVSSTEYCYKLIQSPIITPPPPQPPIVIQQPSWTLSKNASRTCINDNTPDPVAQLSYTIVVTNTGNGTGTLNKVTDQLDSKVTSSSQVTNISSGGTYSNGTITWNLGSSIAPGSSVTLTYKVSVAKEAFGSYVNSAYATVGSGNTPSATKTINATCNVLVKTANWNIAKYGSEQCVETDSVLSYNIVITNTGEATGQLDKVEDQLDSSIVEGQISSMSTGGTYSAGKITWDLEGTAEDVTSGGTKTFSYVVTIALADYGTYSNTATAYPREAPSLSDTVTLTAQCEPPVLNPSWSLSKQAVERCADEGTDSPTAEVTYLVTVTNIGAGTGTLGSVVDVLDSKVQDSYVSGISTGGTLSGGQITWSLEGDSQTVIPGEKRTFSYIVSVPTSAFGTYANTVTAYPTAGENPTVTLTLDADCVIADPEQPVIVTYIPPTVTITADEIPDTGIFDDVELPLIVGFTLLILGFTWRILGRGMYISVETIGKLPKKVSIHMKDVQQERKLKQSTKRKQKFEKKVGKRF